MAQWREHSLRTNVVHVRFSDSTVEDLWGTSPFPSPNFKTSARRAKAPRYFFSQRDQGPQLPEGPDPPLLAGQQLVNKIKAEKFHMSRKSKFVNLSE